MKRKILIPVIIVIGLSLIVVSIFSSLGSQKKPISVPMEEGLPIQTETKTAEELQGQITALTQQLPQLQAQLAELRGTPAKNPKESEIEKLQGIDSSFTLEVIQESVFIDGTVKEIVVRNCNFCNLTIYGPWMYFHTGDRLHRGRFGYLLEWSGGEWYSYPTSQTEYDVED